METPDLWTGVRVANSAGDQGLTAFELAVYLKSKIALTTVSLKRLEAEGRIKSVRDGKLHPTTRWIGVRAAQRQALRKAG